MPNEVKRNELTLQKVAIVGIGAIGGVFAAWLGSRLPAGTVQLSALARGATLQRLQSAGLHWTDAPGTVHQVPVRASESSAELGVQDLVILCVKGPAVAGLAASIRSLLGPHTVVLVAMNGVPWWFAASLPGHQPGLQLRSVDPDGLIGANIGLPHVLGCVVHVSASAPRPATVVGIRNNQLIIGEPAGGESARAQAVAALLQAAGFDVRVSSHIQKDIWFKLWGNMTMNPVSALTGATCDRILDDPLVRGFCTAVMLEAQAIGQQIGCGIDQQPEDRHAITRSLGAFKTSMLQDVEAGRALELDALLGAVRELGQAVGQATPNIDALLGLTRLMAQQRGLYPAG